MSHSLLHDYDTLMDYMYLESSSKSLSFIVTNMYWISDVKAFWHFSTTTDCDMQLNAVCGIHDTAVCLHDGRQKRNFNVLKTKYWFQVKHLAQDN